MPRTDALPTAPRHGHSLFDPLPVAQGNPADPI